MTTTSDLLEGAGFRERRGGEAFSADLRNAVSDLWEECLMSMRGSGVVGAEADAEAEAVGE